MGARAGRIVVATVACLLWLNGCETSTKLGDLFQSKTDTTASRPPPPGADPATTGSTLPPIGDHLITGTVPPPPPPTGELQPDAVPKGLLGNDPNDDLNLGKKHFRAANFGLAERHFRRAVELHPRDLESWIGLAASYDRLRRFDLADRAYDQATKIAGPSAELLNNWGYSYMLRGDYRRARETLLQAQAQDPANPYVKNNLELLEASFRKGKAIQ
jgi:tetratricopeptide (TPR) repeat protein